MSKRPTAGDGGAGAADGEAGVDRGAEAIYAFADRLQQGAEDEEEEREALETWVTFAVGAQTLGLPVESVREIVRVGEITRVPHAPEAVRGAFGYRDRAVPLVDLGVRLGGGRLAVDGHSRIVVVTARGRLIGLLADRVLRVLSLAPSTFSPPEGGLAPRLAATSRGLAAHDGDPIALLDVERLLVIDEATEPTEDEES